MSDSMIKKRRELKRTATGNMWNIGGYQYQQIGWSIVMTAQPLAEGKR